MLIQSVICLLAALICVPISQRLGFGSILGYLVAGIVLGPFGLRLIQDPDRMLHFAQFGVVLLLFVIGLELRPARLWVMRRMVFGLGTAQFFLSAALLALLAWAAGMSPKAALIIGCVLALSSTALGLQLLAEKKQLTASYGRAAFSILLLQDLAVIPLLAILPLIGASAGIDSGFNLGSAAIGVATILALTVGGRYLLRPILNFAAGSHIPEIMTATSLLVVIASALLMQFAGMSMVLGAFIAGMLLADSEYRHQLAADIAPFKGLLLGLFFISVGMSVNLGLLADAPARIASITFAMMLTKAIVLLPLARRFGMCDRESAIKLAAVMSQGGEFAFVLLGIASTEKIIPLAISDELILAVAVSMLLTPFVYLGSEILTRKSPPAKRTDFDPMEDEHNAIILAGFGRVGQIVGRLLRTVNQPFTALEIDPAQVSVVRRYGNKVYFGDASRLDVLRAAGAGRAKLFVLALADTETSLQIAATVIQNFPNMTIIARAHNRRHAHQLMDLGIQHIIRDTLFSSYAITEQVLTRVGFSDADARHITETFHVRDERLMREQHAMRDSEEQLIQSSKLTAAELEVLLRHDLKR